MKLGRKTLAIVLLFIGLVLVNYLASSIPARFDVTAEKIYTLSPGTKALIAKIEEPLTLDLYASKDTPGLPVAYKNYVERVQEMLRQYVRAAHGRITLNVINPRPDTPEEERATAAALTAQAAPQGGEQFFFGLVAIQADQQKVIAAFNPQRESLLEYDISQLIYSVQQFEKKKIGLFTSLPIMGSGPAEMQMSMPQSSQPGQFVASEWIRSFEIVNIEPTATELPAGLDVVALIHPGNVLPKLQFAIDQFLLSGKPVLIAVDPSSQYYKRMANGQTEIMMGTLPPNVSSDLPGMLGAYGVDYNAQKVVGDLDNAAQVGRPQGNVVSYPLWLNLLRPSLNQQFLPAAQLNSLLFVEAGSLSPKPGTGLTFTPLIETSARSGELDSSSLQFAQVDDITRQIVPSGKKTIAALVTGKFSTAFHYGMPGEGKPADPNKKDNKPQAEALKESKTTSTLLVFADTDWLFDDYSVRKMNFFGQISAKPINDNLALAANTMEFLGGSQDLISIRGKGGSLRPFDVVRDMEVKAQARFQEKLNALEAHLNEVQAKLTELQNKKTEANSLVAPPEIGKAIEDFQKQDAALRGERREIRKALREDIEALENRLLVLNLLATPLLVGVFGLWFYNARRK